MKNLLIAISLVSIVTFGNAAFAMGMGGWGGGHMAGPNNGGHMMDRGYGGHTDGSGYGGYKGGQNGQRYEKDRKFLDETADLRRELHEKRFEYNEANRHPDTTIGTLRALEKKMYELEKKINEMAPAPKGGYWPNY